MRRCGLTGWRCSRRCSEISPALRTFRRSWWRGKEHPQGRPKAKAFGYQPLPLSPLRDPKETQGDPRLKPWATSLGLPALGYLNAKNRQPRAEAFGPPRSQGRQFVRFYLVADDHRADHEEDDCEE